MIYSKSLLIVLSTLLTICSTSSSSYGDRHDSQDLTWLFSEENLEADENDHVSNAIVEKSNVCETEECRQVTEEFLASMNKSADPCKDFYEFTCGGWASKTSIPKYAPQWSRFKIFEAAVHHRIKGILETESEETDIFPVRQAKDWYQSCMDESSREIRGLLPIGSILRQIGGWPMTMSSQEWNEDDYTWQKIDEYFIGITGSSTFFKFEFLPLQGDDPIGRMNIKGPDVPFGSQLPLGIRNYDGDDLIAYKTLIRQMARAFIVHNQANVSDEQLDEDIEELIKFEKMIYVISSDATKNAFERLKMNSKFDLKGFINYFENNMTKKSSYPKQKIHWRPMLEQIFGMINIEIKDSSKISYADWRYLYILPEIFKSTSQRIIINYIYWKFVSDYMRFTDNKTRNMFFELLKNEYGVQEQIPRWQECVIQMGMSDVAAYLFVDEYYPNEKDKAVRETLNAIKNSFKSQIDSSNWMDDGAKAHAKERMDTMHLLLGFPDWLKNETAMIKYYQGLTIGHEYLDNILSFVRYRKKVELREFVGSDRREPWPIDPITINAIYKRNTIVVTAADFQSPLLGEKVPDYVNYGTVGLFIGHEMGHGFDDNNIMGARNFSAVLSSADMLNSYYQRVSCFTQQYDKYYGTEAPLSREENRKFWGRTKSRASRTKSENIADTTGLQAVFDAYKKLLKTKEPKGELKLSGFEEFSDEQMFFISFGQMWCEISTPKFDKKKEQDPHSPGHLRVIGAVSNTNDFGRVFNCPLGSPMNPEDKCSIWTKPGAKRISKNMRHRRIGSGGWKQNWN